MGESWKYSLETFSSESESTACSCKEETNEFIAAGPAFLVIAQGMLLVFIGRVAGLASALALTRLMSSFCSCQRH